MKRKLASVQEIISLEPIEGADRILKAKILGWNVIVRKDEFRVGEKVVFFEIDSVLPDKPWASFLKKPRIRSMKLRGIISQGLALPLHIVEEDMIFEVDQDLTETLGVKKHIPNIRQKGTGAKQGRKLGEFPSHLVPKTDELRVQSKPEVLEELKGSPYIITVKLDGTSATYLWCDEEFTVCSRNTKRKEDDTNIYWLMAKKYKIQEKLPKNIAIQGEIVGPGIQRNRLQIPDIDLYIFDAWNIEEQRYLDYKDLSLLCYTLNFQMVPISELSYSFNYDLDTILKKAEGEYITGGEREGIVIRSQTETYSKALKGRMSFKAINNKFLLKIKE